VSLARFCASCHALNLCFILLASQVGSPLIKDLNPRRRPQTWPLVPDLPHSLAQYFSFDFCRDKDLHAKLD
jgi:hypothetical protein